MITKRRFLLAALAVTICGGLASVSRADLTVTVTGPSGSSVFSNSGATPGNTSVGGAVNFSGVSGAFAGASDLQSNSLSALFTASLQLTNTSGAPETITINTTDLPFTMPSGSPLTLSSTLSVSSLSTAADSVTSVSSINPTPSGTPVTSTSPITVNGPSGTVITSTIAPDPGGAFELANNSSVTLAPGSEATFTVTTEVAAVPEPSALKGLVGIAGLMGLGLAWQLRRSRTM